MSIKWWIGWINDIF